MSLFNNFMTICTIYIYIYCTILFESEKLLKVTRWKNFQQSNVKVVIIYLYIFLSNILPKFSFQVSLFLLFLTSEMCSNIYENVHAKKEKKNYIGTAEMCVND